MKMMRVSTKREIKVLVAQCLMCLMLVSIATIALGQFGGNSPSLFVRAIGRGAFLWLSILIMGIVCLVTWLIRLPIWGAVIAGIAYYCAMYVSLTTWVSSIEYQYCISPSDNAARDLCEPMLYSALIGGMLISMTVTVVAILISGFVFQRRMKPHRMIGR
jgi:hypothetical protein